MIIEVNLYQINFVYKLYIYNKLWNISLTDLRIVKMESNKVLFDAYLAQIWHSSFPDVAKEILGGSKTLEHSEYLLSENYMNPT